MSDSFRPHGLQPARLPRLSLSPGICSNSHPLSPRCDLGMSIHTHVYLYPSYLSWFKCFRYRQRHNCVYTTHAGFTSKVHHGLGWRISFKPMRIVFHIFYNFFLFCFLGLYWICYNIAAGLYFIFWPQCIWDLSSQTRDWTLGPSVGRRNLNHWTIW